MAPFPREVDPSRKVTVPVAIAGESVAVNVTEALNVEGFGEDVRVVVVGVRFTT
jgi:hypothetical protein